MKATHIFPWLVAGALVAGAGCRRGKDSDQSVPPPITPEVQRILDHADKSPEAALALLNETMKDWLLRHPEHPKSLQEFVTGRALPRLPVPPAGKEFAVDRTRGVVVLVDK